MRISVIESDSGFPALQRRNHQRADVLLNGEKLTMCLTADEELGEVLVTVFEAENKLKMDGDRVATEWKRGRVEIIWL